MWRKCRHSNDVSIIWDSPRIFRWRRNVGINERRRKRHNWNSILFAFFKKVRIVNEKPREIILLKNNNVLVIDYENKFKIYDNKFESLQLEYLNDFNTPFVCCKYFPTSGKYNPDFLYLFENNNGKRRIVLDPVNKVYIYKILYYKKKNHWNQF